MNTFNTIALKNILSKLPKTSNLLEIASDEVDLNDVLLYIKGCAESADQDDILVLCSTVTLLNSQPLSSVESCIKQAIWGIYKDKFKVVEKPSLSLKR